MPEGRPRSIRLAATANIVLGVLALLSIFLARDPLAALWSAGFVGFGLIVWGSVEAWAARSAALRGTKLLAMFMAILGIVLGGSSFLMQDAGPFRWASILLGLTVFLANILGAIIAPDEERRGQFEPRRRDDVARPPT